MHATLLQLPPRSPHIAYRAYAGPPLGWALRRFAALPETAGFSILVHDDADERAVAAHGHFAIRSYHGALRGLAEFATLYAGRPVLLLSLETALTPAPLLAALLAAHAAGDALATRLAGWPEAAGAEIVHPAVLRRLGGLDLPDPVRPSQYLALWGELAPGRRPVAEVDARALGFTAPPGLDEPCRTVWDAWRWHPVTASDPAAAVPPAPGPDDGGGPGGVRLPRPAPLAPGSRLRVLYATPASGLSGAEVSLCQMVASLDPARVEALAAVGFEGALTGRLRAAGASVFAPDAHYAESRPAVRDWARELLAAWRPDLLHANSFLGEPLLAALAAAGTPWIQHVRNADFDLLTGSLRRATAIVAISAFVRDRLIAAGLPAARIEVIPNGIDAAWFDPRPFDRAAARRALGLGAAPAVLMMGRCVRQKRFDLLLRAVARLGSRARECTLLLAADREQWSTRQELERLAAELGLAGRVRWLEYAEDVRPLLAAADLAVLPSDREASGRVILEAMAFGLPALGSDDGGIAELIGDGVTGRLFRAGSETGLAGVLGELLEDPAAAWRLGRAARQEVIARWDGPHRARVLTALYERLAASRQ